MKSNLDARDGELKTGELKTGEWKNGEFKNEVELEVIELMSSEFGLPREEVLPEKKLMDDLGLDSIDLCDALVQLESRTGRPFPLEHFRGVVTIADFVEVASTILRSEQER